jgi:hypothetical protein
LKLGAKSPRSISSCTTASWPCPAAAAKGVWPRLSVGFGLVSGRSRSNCTVQMSDKPFFVKYGYSVALDRSERFGRSGTKRVSRSLTGWRKTIERLRSEAQIQHGLGIRLVYFCPLNINDNHFTLLEINEQKKKIYRYNSMADQGVIDSTVKLTRVGKMVVVSQIHDRRPRHRHG